MSAIRRLHLWDAKWRKQLPFKVGLHSGVGYPEHHAADIRHVYRVLRKAGLPDHSARHHITMLLRAGESVGRNEHHDMVMAAFRKAEGKA